MSNDGIIVGPRGKALKTRINKDGYVEVSLGSAQNRNGRVRVHRVVAELFVDNPSLKPEVNHIDFNRKNNIYTNLEWVTHLDNIKHSVESGHFLSDQRYGEHNGRSILTTNDIVEIRKKLSSGIPATHIAKSYNVGSSTIYNIKAKNTWKHIS